jgi:hypothetical protein
MVLRKLTVNTIGLATIFWRSNCINIYSFGVLNLGAPCKQAAAYLSDGRVNTTTEVTFKRTYGASYTTGDVIGVALNLDAGAIVGFYKNNSLIVTRDCLRLFPAGTWISPAVIGTGILRASIITANFGQRAFAYPLSGFKALCDTNLGAPLVRQA